MHRILLLLSLILSSLAHAELPAVSFFYGPNPPWEVLQAFDLVVVDPDHVPDPGKPALSSTRIAAYVAVGEVQPGRSYAAKLPKEWLIGENAAWGSRVIDQAAAGWPAFFIEQILAPLWQAGYRDFFLDTLDSYHLVARDEAARARQEAGLVAVVRAVKQRFPEARLIFNRGFEILPEVHADVFAVAAESLFEGYDAGQQRYRPVPAADREWLTGQLDRVRNEYRLPVIAIDYVPPDQREKARDTARRISAAGYIPWVASPALDTVGIGRIEAMPRKILAIHEPLADEYALRYHNVIRLASLPLNYLGYAVETADPNGGLPAQALSGQVAGIIVWMNELTNAAARQTLLKWLEKQADDGIPFVLLGNLDFLFDTPLAMRLGVQRLPASASREPVRIESKSALSGFERQPTAHPSDFVSLQIFHGTAHLTLSQGKQRQVAMAVMPWGGFAVTPHVVANLPGDGGERWVIDPFAFFRTALRLPDIPVPDVTTESGRRMLMVHMDGDGFPSRAELKGSPYAGAVIRDRIVRHYRLPMTLSIIEGELSAEGLYPKESPALEAIARDIFAEPNVEIASHSRSHPFIWRMVESGAAKSNPGGYSLQIPGYQFDARREVEGSVRYIQERLAPPGKKVKMFLWTGDCIPGSGVLGITHDLGIMNMNGGDTTTTRSQSTLTRVEGLGIQRGEDFQVFAPNQNENVYTNNWTGPFYGYHRVIETFELTGQPRRLKPIDIYFHTYIATKPQGLKSLQEAFEWALDQDTAPVFASEYARKVLDFPRVAIARTTNGWRVRGTGQLRTLRWPATMGQPDLTGSDGVAGYIHQGDAGYLHLSAPQAEWRFADGRETGPRLVSANGRVTASRLGDQTGKWQLQAHVPLDFSLAHVTKCRVLADGKSIEPVRREGDVAHFRLKKHAAAEIEAICRH